MSATDFGKQVAVFAAIVAVIVGGAAVAPFVVGDEGPTYTDVTNEQYQPNALLPDETAEEGEIVMESGATNETVLIDVGHRNSITEEDVQPLVSALVANGHRVQFYEGNRQSLNESLRQADAFVIANPQARYTAAERDGVEAFTDAGGRVVMLGDPPSVRLSGGFFFGRIETVSGKHTSLSSRYGIAFDSGYLYNMEDNDNNFKSIFATSAANGSLGAGVSRVVMREAAPLTASEGTTVLVGSDGTRFSATREAGTYAVAVQSGNVAAIGDTDFLSRESAYDADNEVLIGNLADFLVSGEKRPGAPKEPQATNGERPPRPPTGGGAPPRPPTATATPTP